MADRVEKDHKDGHHVVVVLSAMSGETDRLLKLAHEVDAVSRTNANWICCSRPESG